MPKTKISEYSATANSNTDVASINIDEGCAPSGINNAIRAVMGHLKDFQSGTNGDPFNGPVNGTVGATTPSTGAFTTLSASSTVTLSGGTANGVAYLNGSKVVTTGSALVFDGTNLGVGTSSPAAKFEVSTGAATKMRLTSTADNNADIDFYTNSVQRGIIEFNSVGGLIYTVPSLPLTFGTNNTERARIDSSGNLLVGTTGLGTIGSSSGSTITASGAIYSASTGESIFSRRSSDGDVILFRRDTTGVGSIAVTTVLTTYNTTSDYRLKNITGALTGAKDFIMALQPKQGTWKADGSKFVGFLAHEFQEVSPSSVTGEKDAVDADGKPIMQSMQASSAEVMANLVAFVQELKAEFDAYKASHL